MIYFVYATMAVIAFLAVVITVMLYREWKHAPKTSATVLFNQLAVAAVFVALMVFVTGTVVGAWR